MIKRLRTIENILVTIKLFRTFFLLCLQIGFFCGLAANFARGYDDQQAIDNADNDNLKLAAKAEIEAFSTIHKDVDSQYLLNHKASEEKFGLSAGQPSELISKEQLSDGEREMKCNIVSNWKDSFKRLADPILLDEIFTKEAISRMAASIDSIDAFEVFGRFNKLGFAAFFKEQPCLFDVLEPNLRDLFSACVEFVSLFRYLSSNYYKDRRLATYLKVIMTPNLKIYPAIYSLWSSVFEVCSNSSDLEELDFLANNYFELLTTNKTSSNKVKIKKLIDYIFTARAYEIHTKTLNEFKKIDQALEDMCAENWLEQHRGFLEKYYNNRALRELVGRSGATVVADKIKQAKAESARRVSVFAKDLASIADDLERLKRDVTGAKDQKRSRKDKRAAKRNSFKKQKDIISCRGC